MGYACLTVAWLAGPVQLLAATYSDLIVFGDSLSDTGNIYRVTAGVIPNSPPYFDGRFTNGPNYVDDLAADLHLSSKPFLAGGDNYAFGGARTNFNSLAPSFDIRDQVRTYALATRHADPNALYIVFGGSNNLRDAIDQATANPNNANAIATNTVQTAVSDLRSILNTLAGLGARNVLVPDAPNLGLVPEVLQKGAMASAFGTNLSQAFNQQLNAMLDTETALKLYRLDTFGLFNSVISNPAGYGVTDVTSSCYSGDALNSIFGGSVCSSPNTHLFWDGLHPTSTGHAILAQAAFSLLEGGVGVQGDAVLVPEPPSWTLVLSGIALWTIWRRGSKPAHI